MNQLPNKDYSNGPDYSSGDVLDSFDGDVIEDNYGDE